MLWLGLFAALAFCGEGLGYAACRVIASAPPATAALAAAACAAILVGAVAAVLLNWLLLDDHRLMAAELSDLRRNASACHEMEAQLASRAEGQRKLRHDLRGALSPALLTADRLLGHEDPRVRRAGEIMVKSVDRAASLLADPAEAAASPPADP